MLEAHDKLNVSYSENMAFIWFRVAKTGTRTLNHLLSEACTDCRYVARGGAKAMQASDVERINNLIGKHCFSFSIVRNPWDRVVSAWLNKIKIGPRDPWYTPKVRESQYRMCRALDPSLSPTITLEKDFDWFIQHLPESKLFRNNVHFMPQTEILSGSEIDYVGRFEEYEQSVRHIFDRIGLAIPAKLPHENISKPSAKDFRHYFSKESKATVAKLYAADIERYGYSYG